MASDIWLRTILIVIKETRCRHIGYSYRLKQGFFYMHHPTDRITHTTAFVTPVVEHWLEREIAQWVVLLKGVQIWMSTKNINEGNVLFNDAFNTFYLRLYGVGHMVKDLSDSEREETRCRHMGYSFWINSKDSFISTISQTW